MTIIRKNVVYIFLLVYLFNLGINLYYHNTDHYFTENTMYGFVIPLIYSVPGLGLGLYYLLNKNMDQEYKNSVIHLVLTSMVIYNIWMYIVNGFFLSQETTYTIIHGLSIAISLVMLLTCLLGYRKGSYSEVFTKNENHFMKSYSVFILSISVAGFLGLVIIRNIYNPILELTLDKYLLKDLIIIIALGNLLLGMKLLNNKRLISYMSTIYIIAIYLGYFTYDLVKYIEYRRDFTPMNIPHVIPYFNQMEPQSFLRMLSFSSPHIKLLFVGVVGLIVLIRTRYKEIETQGTE